MLTGSITIQRANLRLEQMLKQFVERTAKSLEANVRKYTPKRSGLAARSWSRSKQTDKDYLIKNNKQYVPRLDKGYSSKAPNGFYKPAVRDTQRSNRGRFIK